MIPHKLGHLSIELLVHLEIEEYQTNSLIEKSTVLIDILQFASLEVECWTKG